MRLYGNVVAAAAAVMMMVVEAAAATEQAQTTVASRILVVDLFGTRSHKNFIMAIAEELAQRNHAITYLTGFESTRARPNVREVYIPNTNFFNSLPNLFTSGQWDIIWNILPIAHTFCAQGLASSEFQNIQEQKFDLVILSIAFTDCFLPYAYKNQIPVIYVSPNMVQGAYSDLAGTPYFSSIGGNYFLDLEFPLTLTGRLLTSLYDQFSVVWTYWHYIPRMDAECRTRKLFPDDVPSLEKLRVNSSSLLIANSVRTLETPAMPYTPTVVHAGGIHCRPSQPLPPDMEEWAAGSGTAGFILFSLGTLVKPSNMPEKYRSVLLKVFASLEQRVLWKWDEETMEGLPPNVRVSKWLPQQDVLGHPQLKIFITHGGLLSLQEATYHGVPVLGLPVAVDQRHNLNKAQREGWGRALHWEDLTYDTLRSSILDVIHDTRMREEVLRRSSVMRDQPVSPGAWTTYWVEYVIRHRGATHLRCPAVHMPWYQLYNVNVWLMVVVVTAMVLLLVLCLAYKCLRCVFSRCLTRTMAMRNRPLNLLCK